MPTTSTFDPSTGATDTFDTSALPGSLSGPTGATSRFQMVMDALAKIQLFLMRLRGTFGWDPRWFGAAFDGTTNDYTALNNCVTTIVAAGGGVMVLPAGTTCINALLTIPNKVSVKGAGSGLVPSDSATVIKCTTSAAGLKITSGGSSYENFHVDGNNVSNIGIQWDVVASGAQFTNVSVSSCALDGWVISNAQNGTFIGCQSNYNGRDGLVLQTGTGGHLFERFESVNNVGKQLKIQYTAASGSGYTMPTQIRFVQGLFELFPATHSGGSVVVITLGANISFSGTIIAGRPTGAGVGSLLDVSGSGTTVSLQDVGFNGNGAFAFASAIVGGNGSLVVDHNCGYTTDCTAMYSTAGSGQFVRTGTSSTAIPPITAGTSLIQLQNFVPGPMTITARASSDYVAFGSVTGEAGQRFRLLADGSLVIGDGTNYTFDVGTSRDGSGNLVLSHKSGQRASAVNLGVTGTLGYVAGAGGTVTQATSKSTGVTLSKASGQITMHAAALAAGTIVSFVLTNTQIAATDVLILNHVSGGTPGSYSLNARCAAGSATIDVRNNTGGSLSEAIVIGFVVIKAVTS